MRGADLQGPALAVHLRGLFAKRKTLLLRAVAQERKTPGEVIAVLEKLYEKHTRQYLRASGTTYGDWLVYGPLGELDEVRSARCDDSVWDRLVDKHAPRGDT